MANFEVFHWTIASSINISFLKCAAMTILLDSGRKKNDKRKDKFQYRLRQKKTLLNNMYVGKQKLCI